MRRQHPTRPGALPREPDNSADRLHFMSERLSHLDRLEAGSLHIIREVAAECRNPVMLNPIGKDSSERKEREGYF